MLVKENDPKGKYSMESMLRLRMRLIQKMDENLFYEVGTFARGGTQICLFHDKDMAIYTNQ